MSAGAAQFCIEGLRKMMDAEFRDNAIPEDKEIFLFSNDATISDGTTGADLTEIVGNGLDKQTLAKGDFSAATAADPIVSSYKDGTGVRWEAGGSRTAEAAIHGWAIRGVTSGNIYGARNWGLKTVQTDEPVVVNPVYLKLDIPEA